MDAYSIFQKTALGQEEVVSRNHKLSHKLRTMLILIDGNVPALLLQEKARMLGAPEDFIEQLLTANLIVRKAFGAEFDETGLAVLHAH